MPVCPLCLSIQLGQVNGQFGKRGEKGRIEKPTLLTHFECEDLSCQSGSRGWNYFYPTCWVSVSAIRGSAKRAWSVPRPNSLPLSPTCRPPPPAVFPIGVRRCHSHSSSQHSSEMLAYSLTHSLPARLPALLSIDCPRRGEAN